MRRRPRRDGVGLSALRLAVVALVMAACGNDSSDGSRGASRRDASITVASFSFAESRVLAEIYGQALERRQYPVERAHDLASREVVEPALEQGVVDLVPEYLGTALAFVDPNRGDEPSDQAFLHRRLKEAFAARGVAVLAAAPAQNQNGLVVTRETAQRHGLTRVSDLVPIADQLVFGGPPECPERPYCLPGLAETYGLRFKEFRPLDAAGPRTVAALEGNEIDVGLLFTTDGHLGDPKFVLLEDDRDLQPPENIVPVVRRDVISRYGQELVALLDRVSGQLETVELVTLNRRVDLDGVQPSVAAAQWLREHGL
jgi:osmoprotectant transport system substrate-binding protein